MPADRAEPEVYPQYKNLMKAVEGLGFHDHLCLIYETSEEQFAAIVPFVRVGLARGEKCVYVADDNTSAGVIAHLERGGVDVKGALTTGALSVITKKDAYLKQGYFDPDWMIRFLKDSTDEAKAQGFKGLRVTGEMTWVLGVESGSEKLIEYESKLNYFFPENDCLAICQYNIGRLRPELIIDVIRTHPMVIYRGQVCRNLYYTSPEEMLLPNQGYLELSRLLYNILERERLEELNRRSEDGLGRLEDEVEEAQRIGRVGNLEWDIGTGEVNWSGGLCRIFGLDPGMPLPDFKWHLRLYSGESAKKLEAAAEAAIKAGQPFELDLDLAQGAPQRWVIARGGAKRAPDGRVTGLRMTLIEMTGRARSGVEPGNVSGHLLSLAEAMDSIVFWVLSATPERFEYVNAAIEKVWGVKRGDLLVDPALWAGAIHPEDRGALKTCLEQLVSGVKDAFGAEFRVVRPDGSVRRVAGRAVRIGRAADGRALVAGFAEDITGRKAPGEGQSESVKVHQEAGGARLLSGLLPICAYCKKIRNDKGAWESLEKFIRERSEAEFTHCICPDCAERFAKKDIGMA